MFLAVPCWLSLLCCSSLTLCLCLYHPRRIKLSELEQQHAGGHGPGEGPLHTVPVDRAGAPGPDLQVPGRQYPHTSQPPRPHQEEHRVVSLPAFLLRHEHM
jgi:hypothetical protein